MSMGFGTSSLGLSAFGGGDPTSGSSPPIATQASRYVNPDTRDYEVDPTTRGFRRMTGLRQRIQLALSTLRGSSTTLQTWGVTIPRKVTASFAAEVEQSVRAALSQLTDVEKLIHVDRVDVYQYAMRSRVTVFFTDLQNKSKASETLNL